MLSVVWAAGRAGFQSGDSAHQSEFENFERVLSLGTRIALKTPRCRVRFFLVSSAGGLYEGQRNVSLSTPAVPLRAYGRFKLMQEQALRQAEGYDASFVYRPSTIYGLALKGRVGLVYALLLNGLRQRVSAISGNATTLRDYVFNRDLGRFIADEILSLTETEAPPRFLVSGKPSSIQEIATIAEDLLGRKLYLSYSPERFAQHLRSQYHRQWLALDSAERGNANHSKGSAYRAHLPCNPIVFPLKDPGSCALRPIQESRQHNPAAGTPQCILGGNQCVGKQSDAADAPPFQTESKSCRTHHRKNSFLADCAPIPKWKRYWTSPASRQPTA